MATEIPKTVAGRGKARMRAFLELDHRRRALLIKTILLLGIIRLGLWLFSFQRVETLVSAGYVRRQTIEGPDAGELEETAWAVRAAGCVVPASTCLVQALAVQWLLGRKGFISQLRFGVNRSEGGSLHAHVWVENLEGRSISDPGDRTEFLPLLSVQYPPAGDGRKV